MTTVVYIPHCQPHSASEPVEPLEVVIAGEVKTDGFDLDEMRTIYRNYGRDLARHLLKHLPGGLFDALLVAMMEEKVTLFKISHMEPWEKP